MNKQLIYCIFCILNSAWLSAQFILNQEGEAFGQKPFFNSELIAADHIKQIAGFYTYKKGDEGFKPSSDRLEYNFNQKGQLISSMEILNKGNLKDSSFHHYAYFENGQLQMHRYTAYGGAISEHYLYDSIGRLISVALYRDQYDHHNDTLLSSIKMRTETLRYHLDSQANYTRYNNYQRPYLEVKISFDGHGLITEEQRYYRFVESAEVWRYTYNKTGLLSEKQLTKSEITVPVERWRYDYDQWGNIIEMQRFEEGIFKTEFQIVYDYKTGFLGSIIKKDNASNQLSILRFTDYKHHPSH